MVVVDELRTGDLLLFETKPPKKQVLSYMFDKMINLITRSKYTHCGMVLINPKFVNLPDGIYLWESGIEKTLDPQDNEKKFGVQICNMSTYYKNWGYETKVYVRQWHIIDRKKQNFQ